MIFRNTQKKNQKEMPEEIPATIAVFISARISAGASERNHAGIPEEIIEEIPSGLSRGILGKFPKKFLEGCPTKGGILERIFCRICHELLRKKK